MLTDNQTTFIKDCIKSINLYYNNSQILYDVSKLTEYKIDNEQTDGSLLQLHFDLYNVFNRPTFKLHERLAAIIKCSDQYLELKKFKFNPSVQLRFKEIKKFYNTAVNYVVMNVGISFTMDPHIIELRQLLLNMKLIKNWEENIACKHTYVMKTPTKTFIVTSRPLQEGSIDQKPIMSTDLYLKCKKSISKSGRVGSGLAFIFEDKEYMLEVFRSAIENATISDLVIKDLLHVNNMSTSVIVENKKISLNFLLPHANVDDSGTYSGLFNSDDMEILSILASDAVIPNSLPLPYLGRYWAEYYLLVKNKIEELIDEQPFENEHVCSIKCCNKHNIFIARNYMHFIVCNECHHQKCVRCSEMYTSDHTCIPSLDLAEYIREGGVICPGCHVPVEKVEGCNHMTCSRCATEFCMLCGQKYAGPVAEHHYMDYYGPSCRGRESTADIDLNPIALLDRWQDNWNEDPDMIRDALQVQRDHDMRVMREEIENIDDDEVN